MRFCGARAWAGPAERLGGTSVAPGRRAEGRGSRTEEQFQPCGVWQCRGRGSGSP